jgi:hypothetical protein
VINTSRTCGHTELEAIADAKTLGLLQEFQSGIYTCCQIAEWAAEQSLAWFEATCDCRNPDGDATTLLESDEKESVLVPVRTRRPQVPWFRGPDHLG